MNRQKRKLMIRGYSFIVALLLMLIVFNIVSDGLTLKATAPELALTIAFVAILAMVIRIEPKKMVPTGVKQRDYLNWLLCCVAVIGSAISRWLTCIYTDIKTIQALPFVLALAMSPIWISLLLRWHRLNKHEPPAV